MPDYRLIYENDAERYQQLVAAEDYQGELPRKLERLVTLDGARVLEVGMGTGRITRMMLDGGASVIGYERSPAMMAVARRLLGERFQGHVADIRQSMLPPASADVALAGWALGHFCEWYAGHWQLEIDSVLGKMWGALDTEGTLIVIETLGTGSESPHAPNGELADYYRFLEGSWGMQREELRTDYRFESLETALTSIGFFFGPELASVVRERNWLVVPEWTGLWWRRK
jgi:SAM-dependent methyltransferase